MKELNIYQAIQNFQYLNEGNIYISKIKLSYKYL